jgi:acetyl-CoA carboxylase carboxyl transferase subunit beta
MIVERKDLREKIGSLLSILLKKNSAINSSENETTESNTALTKAS